MRDRDNARALSRAWYYRNTEKVKANVEEWRDANRDRVRATARTSMARQREAARLAVLEAYGGRCACCGESEPMFLALDHVNGLQGERKNSHQTRRDAILRGFPADYQLLCHNCNLGRSLNGGVCPHKKGINPEAGHVTAQYKIRV
jgi:hypothetical protein